MEKYFEYSFKASPQTFSHCRLVRAWWTCLWQTRVSLMWPWWRRSVHTLVVYVQCTVYSMSQIHCAAPWCHQNIEAMWLYRIGLLYIFIWICSHKYFSKLQIPAIWCQKIDTVLYSQDQLTAVTLKQTAHVSYTWTPQVVIKRSWALAAFV